MRAAGVVMEEAAMEEAEVMAVGDSAEVEAREVEATAGEGSAVEATAEEEGLAEVGSAAAVRGEAVDSEAAAGSGSVAGSEAVEQAMLSPLLHRRDLRSVKTRCVTWSTRTTRTPSSSMCLRYQPCEAEPQLLRSQSNCSMTQIRCRMTESQRQPSGPFQARTQPHLREVGTSRIRLPPHSPEFRARNLEP